MENTGNTVKDQEKPADQPMAENSPSLAPKGRRYTKSGLTASDRLEIAQQAIVDLEIVGIHARVAPLFGVNEMSVAIVLPNVTLVNGRLAVVEKEQSG